MSYDQRGNKPGASKEIDAIAHSAAGELKGANPKAADVNAEDPSNKHNCPAGNPEDPQSNPNRKI